MTDSDQLFIDLLLKINSLQLDRLDIFWDQNHDCLNACKVLHKMVNSIVYFPRENFISLPSHFQCKIHTDCDLLSKLQKLK